MLDPHVIVKFYTKFKEILILTSPLKSSPPYYILSSHINVVIPKSIKNRLLKKT